MDNRYIADPSQEEELRFWQNALKLNTAIPAIVDEFDVATQRVSATPATKAKYIDPDGNIKYIDYPKITNIPLAITKCPGLKITCPVKVGQNCTLIFSQRSIDNFLLEGKILPPAEGPDPTTSTLRCMDMTDAMCFPGIITNKEAIPNYNNSAIEIRSSDGSTKISVEENGLNFVQGGATLTMSGGNVEINATAITINGVITMNGKDWDTHVHTGVTTGQSNTGVMA